MEDNIRHPQGVGAGAHCLAVFWVDLLLAELSLLLAKLLTSGFAGVFLFASAAGAGADNRK